MKKSIPILCIVLLVGIHFCGCTGAAISCQTIYDECEDKISADEDTFIDNCIDEYFDEDGDCKDSVRDYARCVKDNGCSSISCLDDYLQIANDCGVDALQIGYGK